MQIHSLVRPCTRFQFGPTLDCTAYWNGTRAERGTPEPVELASAASGLQLFAHLCSPHVCRFGSRHFGTGYGSATASVNGSFHNPRSSLVQFLAMALVGCGPLSCSVRLGAPLATGKFTRLVRVCTAGGTPQSEYLFLSKRFRLHADYDATILSASCVRFP
jgi:hypothetical protein